MRSSLQKYSREMIFLGVIFICLYGPANIKVSIGREKIELPIYGINIPRRRDRREAFLSRFKDLQPRIIAAMDGRSLDSLENSTLTTGEHACFMSHIRALSAAVKEGSDQFLILEDDAMLFFPDQMKVINNIRQNAPQGWGAISLAANSLPLSAKHIGGQLYTLNGGSLLGTQAIIYRKKWASLLLSLATSNPISLPWDLWISQKLKDNLFVHYPSLAPPANITDSDTLLSHDIAPTSFTRVDEVIAKFQLPVEDFHGSQVKLDASNESCIASVRALYSTLQNRIGRFVDTCRLQLIIEYPSQEKWSSFLLKNNIRAMNMRSNNGKFLFSGSSSDEGLFFIALSEFSSTSM